MYLKTVEVTKSYRSLNEGDWFDLENLTLLVGDQGCGKSTMLHGLMHHQKQDFLKIKLTEKTNAGVDCFYFDSEKMNPRITDPIAYSNPNGTSKGIGIASALQSRFRSHGEVLEQFTVNALKTAEKSIIFLDEPESGLSLRNQFRLWDVLQEAIYKDCQIVMATHSLVLIQACEWVLSLEHRKWMPSFEFIRQSE